MNRRLMLFAIAGGIGFCVDAGVLLLAAPMLGPFGGRVLSFTAALLVTWTINRNFAFADKAVRSGKRAELLRYFGAMLPGAAVNWLVYGLVAAFLAGAPIGLVLGAAAGSLAGLATNFVAADRLAFRR